MTRDLLPGEEWRPIPGWEGRYEVSNLGRVYSIRRPGSSRSGRIKRLRMARNGHRETDLFRGLGPERKGVHQLVLLAFVGPCPAGAEIRHLNGDPTDNRVGNLKYGTRSENVLDRALHRDPEQKIPRCRRGHSYTPENTVYVSTRPGLRYCRTCARVRKNRKPEERREPTRVYSRAPIKHGTDGGYKTHSDRNQPVPAGDPCGCRRAHANAVAARAARQRARAAV